MWLNFNDALRGLVDDFQSGKLSVDRDVRGKATKEEIRETLVSCLLSSGWKYEKASSAAQQFSGMFPIAERIPSLNQVKNFLCSPSVRHRFPELKSKQLHMSIMQLAEFPYDILYEGADIRGERIVRDIIQRRFPGLGYKQTSMFMRNIGAAHSLAVIDVHIIWYIEMCYGKKIGAITPKKYIQIEDIIHKATSEFQIDLNSFDVILWVLVREIKKAERKKTCGTQYVLPLVA